MKLLLEKAEVEGTEKSLTDSKVILAKFVSTGGLFVCPQGSHFHPRWRPHGERLKLAPAVLKGLKYSTL